MANRSVAGACPMRQAVEDRPVDEIDRDVRMHVGAQLAAHLRLADGARRRVAPRVDDALEQRGADRRIVLGLAEQREHQAPGGLRRGGRDAAELEANRAQRLGPRGRGSPSDCGCPTATASRRTRIRPTST
nr:hypothetical protein [Gemmatirosa kalamazoonensis]